MCIRKLDTSITYEYTICQMDTSLDTSYLLLTNLHENLTLNELRYRQ
jgi:hypothetical protein